MRLTKLETNLDGPRGGYLEAPAALAGWPGVVLHGYLDGFRVEARCGSLPVDAACPCGAPLWPSGRKE